MGLKSGISGGGALPVPGRAAQPGASGARARRDPHGLGGGGARGREGARPSRPARCVRAPLPPAGGARSCAPAPGETPSFGLGRRGRPAAGQRRHSAPLPVAVPPGEGAQAGSPSLGDLGSSRVRAEALLCFGSEPLHPQRNPFSWLSQAFNDSVSPSSGSGAVHKQDRFHLPSVNHGISAVQKYHPGEQPSGEPG